MLYYIRAASCEKLSSGFPTRSDLNWVVQPQKMSRGLKKNLRRKRIVTFIQGI